MVTVSHKGCAADLPTHPYAKDSYGLIADKTNHRCCNNRPKESYRLRVEETLYSLIPRHHGTKEDDEHHNNSSQIFHPPIAERKAPTRSQPRERESYSQRYRRRGISEVMDGV